MKIVDESKSVWYEKYKPQCIDDLIIPEEIKSKLKQYAQTQDLPPLGLFSSNPGTGKSSTANAIIKEIGGEALWINASIDNGIDILRGKIGKFASSNSFDDNIKIVVMDEFDNFTSDGQKAFRGFIDEYSQNCRFIFTGNYKNKIIEPLLERLQVYDFNSFSKQDMVKPIFERLKFILENEGADYEPKALIPVINTYYPRIRSMVGSLQKYTSDNKFVVSESELDDVSSFDEIMGLMDPASYTNMITKVNELNAPDNIYTFLYNNAAKYFDEPKYPHVVLVIAKYQHMASAVRDKNLNCSACLTELMGIKK